MLAARAGGRGLGGRPALGTPGRSANRGQPILSGVHRPEPRSLARSGRVRRGDVRRPPVQGHEPRRPVDHSVPPGLPRRRRERLSSVAAAVIALEERRRRQRQRRRITNAAARWTRSTRRCRRLADAAHASPVVAPTTGAGRHHHRPPGRRAAAPPIRRAAGRAARIRGAARQPAGLDAIRGLDRAQPAACGSQRHRPDRIRNYTADARPGGSPSGSSACAARPGRVGSRRCASRQRHRYLHDEPAGHEARRALDRGRAREAARGHATLSRAGGARCRPRT